MTSSEGIAVSIDSLHEPGSTSSTRATPLAPAERLRTFHLQGSLLVEGGQKFEAGLQGRDLTEEASEISQESLKGWSSVLYNIETLRKRGAED